MIGERTGEVRAGTLAEIVDKGCVVVSGGGHGIAVFHHDGNIHAVDNRCPHMGFPLSKGSLHAGILTCHWHHARFDLCSGGTFDPFADDARVYPTVVRDGEVWIDLKTAGGDRVAKALGRLEDGLEQNLSLVTIKAVLALLEAGQPVGTILSTGALFGARYRAEGWGPGLTIMTAMGNLVDDLQPEEQALALYHGLVNVAGNSDGQAPRFGLDPLESTGVPIDRLTEWFRQFVEVRDAEGAERVLLTAIASGFTPAEISGMMLAAATDHYFLAGGHTVDFINKAFELLERIGWQHASAVLPSVVGGMARAQRSEENNAWRHPIDLVELVDSALARLPDLPMEAPSGGQTGEGFAVLVETLLGEDPAASVQALLEAFERGVGAVALAGAVAYAAALRVARFHTSNEFGDWITVLHTFTYANALQQSLKRAPAPEAARGIFHGAMRLYLDRFLNIPPARLPDDRDVGAPASAEALLDELLALFDRQQEVNAAGALAYRHLAQGHPADRLIQTLGRALLREDGEFHSYQMLEAGVRQHAELRPARPREARYVLVGVARYLAAHAPTSRAMLQTARIALRLHRGDDLASEE